MLGKGLLRHDIAFMTIPLKLKLGETPVESKPSHRLLECDNDDHMPSHFLACKTTFFLTSKGFTNYGH
jgi:hypothetical protein